MIADGFKFPWNTRLPGTFNRASALADFLTFAISFETIFTALGAFGCALHQLRTNSSIGTSP